MSNFTFVPIRGGLNPRGDGIAAADRAKIKSTAASFARTRTGSKPTSKKARKQDAKRKNNIAKGPREEVEEIAPLPFGTLDVRPGERFFEIEEVKSSPDGSAFTSDESDTTESIYRSSDSETGWFSREASPSRSLVKYNSVPPWIHTDKLDPFWTFSVPESPIFSRLIHHRATYLAPPVPDLDMGAETPKSLLFFRNNMSEPAFMYASILMAAGHLFASQQNYDTRLESNVVQQSDITWLRGVTISALNSALRDSSSATSDGVISAVLTLALWERMFGSEEACRAHNRGVKKMLTIRGGIDALDPATAAVMKWMTKSHTRFSDIYPDSPYMEMQPHLNTWAAEVFDESES